MSADVVSAEEAQGMLDRDRIAREVYGLHGGYDGARLARTVVTLHRELAVLRAQLGPLCAVHDALVAAAALPGAGASPEAMVAAVRAQASADAREDHAAAEACLAGIVRRWERADHDSQSIADLHVPGLRAEIEEARDGREGEWWER